MNHRGKDRRSLGLPWKGTNFVKNVGNRTSSNESPRNGGTPFKLISFQAFRFVRRNRRGCRNRKRVTRIFMRRIALYRGIISSKDSCFLNDSKGTPKGRNIRHCFFVTNRPHRSYMVDHSRRTSTRKTIGMGKMNRRGGRDSGTQGTMRTIQFRPSTYGGRGANRKPRPSPSNGAST